MAERLTSRLGGPFGAKAEFSGLSRAVVNTTTLLALSTFTVMSRRRGPQQLARLKILMLVNC
jgi:hypothetical protein